MMEEAFQRSMQADPDDPSVRLIFADWLEEQGDPRGELIRLTWTLTNHLDLPNRAACEVRLRNLLSAGVQPVGPRWTNSVGMSFVWVAPGAFVRGSLSGEPGRQSDEKPHRVSLTRGFYAVVSPVTQAQWYAVMGNNPSHFIGDNRPVECVSWEDCQELCRALNRLEGLGEGSSGPYRLLTEAEWEYACRGGTTSPFFFGSALSSRLANYHPHHSPFQRSQGKYLQQTTEVGAYPANAWGLTDMHGNVFEWCADWYAPYPEHDVENPALPTEGNVRVLRGGSWHSLEGRCRSACRGWGAPGYRGSDVGCRLCFRLDSDYTL
jgi:uncharacterized protein (TIGR02996 family)